MEFRAPIILRRKLCSQKAELAVFIVLRFSLRENFLQNYEISNSSGFVYCK